MSSAALSINYADLLSSELWAQIWLHLDLGVNDGIDLGHTEPDRLLEGQAEFLKLRTISRKFRLSNGRVAFPWFDVAAANVRSTLLKFYLLAGSTWQTRSDLGSIQRRCVSYKGSSPCVVSSKLRQIFLSSTDVHPEWLLPFTTLSCCEITKPEPIHSGMLDVTALYQLPKLAKLCLTGGHYAALKLPSQLTNLMLHDCAVDVQKTCACVSSFQKLKVTDTSLSMPFAERLRFP